MDDRVRIVIDPSVTVQAQGTVENRIRLSTTDDAIPVLQHEIDVLNQRVTNLITFRNRYEFPSFGESCNLYVATDEHTAYYWDGETYVGLSNVEALQADLEEIYGGGSL